MRLTRSVALILLMACCGLVWANSDRDDREASTAANAGVAVAENRVTVARGGSTPILLNRGARGFTCLADDDDGAAATGAMLASEPRPCARGRAIADLGACTRADDCPAVEAWRSLLGPQGLEIASPPEMESGSELEADSDSDFDSAESDSVAGKAPRDD